MLGSFDSTSATPILMKSTGTKLTALLAACALTACSTVTVTTDYDKSASFGKYKTYSLAPASQGQALSPTSEAAPLGAGLESIIGEAALLSADLAKRSS